MTIQLYGFWRSIAAFRVRVALRLKGLPFEEIPVDILSGEQFRPDYAAISAERVGPALDRRRADDVRASAGPASRRAVRAGRAAGARGYRHRRTGGNGAVCQARAEGFSAGGAAGGALLQIAGVCNIAPVRAAGLQ